MKMPLCQESRWNIRPPHSQTFISSWPVSDRRFTIDQVSISIVLNHIPVRIPPVVKYLRSQNVPSYAPDRLVALLGQPLVAQHLCVVVVHLERTVVYMARVAGGHEEAVMVDIVLTTVYVREHSNRLLSLVREGDLKEVGWHDVKVGQIKLNLRFEIAYTESIVTKLVIVSDGSRQERRTTDKVHLKLTLYTAAGPGLNRKNSRIRGLSSALFDVILTGASWLFAISWPYTKEMGNPSGS